MKKSLFLATIFLYLFLGFTTVTHALNLQEAKDTAFPSVKDATYKPLVVIDGVTDKSTTNLTFSDFVPKAYIAIISLAITLAVIMFIMHAFRYLVSETSFTNKEEAKKGMQNVVIGLLLTLSAYLILQTINPNLVKFGFNLTPAPNPAAPAIPPDQLGQNCGISTPPTDRDGVYYVREIPCSNGAGNPDSKRKIFSFYEGTKVQCDAEAAKEQATGGTAYCDELGAGSTPPDPYADDTSCQNLFLKNINQEREVEAEAVYLFTNKICTNPNGILGRVLSRSRFSGTIEMCESAAKEANKKDPEGRQYCQKYSFTSPQADDEGSCVNVKKANESAVDDLPSGTVMFYSTALCKNLRSEWVQIPILKKYNDTYTSCTRTHGESKCRIKN